jgi:phage terminase large subunit
MPKIDFSRIYECINKIYQPYLKCYLPIQLYYGGGSSGKSHFIAQKIVYNFVLLTGYNVLVLRKVAASNHDSTFAEIRKVLYMWGFDENIVQVNESKGSESITCLLNGNKIIFKGMKDYKEREKVKSVTFKTGDLVCVWMEEVTEFVEEDFNQVCIRLRGRGSIRKHLMLSTNPIDEGSWVKARLIDNRLNESDNMVLKSTYKDNKFLTQDDKNRLENYKNLDHYYYMVYCLGEWGSISNAKVFHNIEIHNFEIPEYNMQNLRCGLDFGFVHAQALIRNGYRENELYLFKEYYTKNVYNRPFGEMLVADNFPTSFNITADSAEPGYIAELRDMGFNISPSIKGPGSVKKGYEYLEQLPKIHIHADNCPNAAREFPRAKRRQLADGTICENEYVEIGDDTIAAVRYSQEDFFLGGGDERGTVRRVRGAY